MRALVIVLTLDLDVSRPPLYREQEAATRKRLNYSGNVTKVIIAHSDEPRLKIPPFCARFSDPRVTLNVVIKHLNA